MLLVDVVKFTVGGWLGRSASYAHFSILRRPAFFYLYGWGGMFGVDWQVFQDSLLYSMLTKIKL